MAQQSVLVVDNNPVIIKLMTNFLEKQGYEVRSAENGLEALEVLNNFHPDIIFIDLIMPKIGGSKLCSIIRSMPEMDDVYLAILSGVAVEQDLDFNQFGADFCIAKGPFKTVQDHISNFLKLAKKKRTGPLSQEIIGVEHVFHRQVTAELLLTKQHFEITLDNIAEGFVEISDAGKIIYVNNTFCELTGQEEEKILASSFPDLINPDDQHNAVLDLIKQRPDSLVQIGEKSPVFINNRQVLITFIAISDLDQDKSIIAIIQDITERKKAEKELDRHREQLEKMVAERTAELSYSLKKIKEEVRQRKILEEKKSELELKLRNKHKMEALGTLAEGVAHDFKNILTGIIGFADLLQEDLKTDSIEVKENLKSIISAGNRALDLSNTVLAFSPAEKDDQPRFPVLLEDIINESVDLIKASASSSIIIKKNITPNCGQVMANATQLHQVMMNICTNGIQSIPSSGGTLEINLAPCNIAENSLPASQSAPQGKWIQLTVSDTGEGINPQTMERIFDPYFTTKKNNQGKGLGLAVSKGIIETHGGVIRVQSTQKQGSTFTVFLPLMDDSDKHTLP